MYVGWLLGYGILLHHTSPRGDELMLFLVGVTWVGETAAYLVGSTIGRHKLAPVVSPRKTVEGAAAQVRRLGRCRRWCCARLAAARRAA